MQGTQWAGGFLLRQGYGNTLQLLAGRRCMERKKVAGRRGRIQVGKTCRKTVILRVSPPFPSTTHPPLSGSFFPKDTSGQACHWRREKKMVRVLSREQPNEAAPSI